MEVILSLDKVVDYLKKHKVCPLDFQPAVPVARKEGTNFNLVVRSADSHDFLVKQNRVASDGRAFSSLAAEWLVQELINNFSSLAEIQSLVSKVVLFDRPNGILVSIFYDDYISLDRLYQTRMSFDSRIARIMGMNLAIIHSASYQQQQQREFLAQHIRFDKAARQPGFVQRLNNLNPSIFAKVCPDGMAFYKLYQRFPSFEQAVIELYEQIEPACLIHNDLTLDNFILDSQLDLDSDSIQIRAEQLKIIDWERIIWGDPAVDLGMVVSEYVGGIWLGNLIADNCLDIDTMLSLAIFPLETITPSLKAFLQGYLAQFPQIVSHRPDFLRRVVQFTGIGILNRLSYYVEHHYPFHNNSLCKLQVAKNLLCYPQQGIETIFGATEAELIGCSQTA